METGMMFGGFGICAVSFFLAVFVGDVFVIPFAVGLALTGIGLWVSDG